MLERTLRTFACLVSLIVLAGWTAFAIDETGSASDRSQAQIAGSRATSRADPSPDEERARERIHSRPREVLDDANDVLLRPFAFAIDGSPSRWARRSTGALLALVIYGFGAAYLARWARGRGA